METWDQDFVDLIESGYFQFDENGLGFFYLMQSRAKSITGFQMMEHQSTFPGLEMTKAVKNRGAGGLNCHLQMWQEGYFFIHCGDESAVNIEKQT